MLDYKAEKKVEKIANLIVKFEAYPKNSLFKKAARFNHDYKL